MWAEGRMVTMRVKGLFEAGVFLAISILLLSSTGYGYQHLTVNGTAVDELFVQIGEPVSIEINSTNSAGYLDAVGFEVETLPYTLELNEIRPEAGIYATVEPFFEPGFFYGYTVQAGGGPLWRGAPGGHFVLFFT